MRSREDILVNIQNDTHSADLAQEMGFFVIDSELLLFY